ncbi:MAG: hypothetical protein O7D94_05930 [Planctomycetota bacterium]|nr:hypothetical protein [Planctomycetota bacterium]
MGSRLFQRRRIVLLVGLSFALGMTVPRPAAAQFTSSKVALHTHLDLGALGGGSNGNDC